MIKRYKPSGGQNPPILSRRGFIRSAGLAAARLEQIQVVGEKLAEVTVKFAASY